MRRLWPAVRAALDWVVSLQLPFGGIAWSQEWADGRPGRVNEEALLAGSSSIYQRCAPASPWPTCSTTRSPSGSSPAAGSGHALREHRDLFLDKSDVLDGLVLPGARRRRPRARPAPR